jgi:hypothetical protein
MNNKNVISIACTALAVIIMIPNAFAESVPDWVKNTAGWWDTDAISEKNDLTDQDFTIKSNAVIRSRQ